MPVNGTPAPLRRCAARPGYGQVGIPVRRPKLRNLGQDVRGGVAQQAGGNLLDGFAVADLVDEACSVAGSAR